MQSSSAFDLAQLSRKWRTMSKRDLTYSVNRRGDRQNVDFRVRLLYSMDGVQESVHGRGSDLSEGGLAVYAPIEVNEGVHVRVEFALPYSRRVLWVEAVVRNKQGYRYGLEFLTLSSFQREEIKKLCQTANVMNMDKTLNR
jgi:c-di-GMP-binding flagellar brake protein YcgR